MWAGGARSLSLCGCEVGQALHKEGWSDKQNEDVMLSIDTDANGLLDEVPYSPVPS